jgi:3-oxoacyl-[acyl-carrier protein] reductase
MARNHWGRVINMSSVSGVMGNPGQTNYSAAKAGLIGFTKSLAKELACRAITVNAIAPGFIDTQMVQSLGENTLEQIKKMIPLRRLGTVEDIASCAVFLASDEAAYMTGQVLHMNGGLHM